MARWAAFCLLSSLLCCMATASEPDPLPAGRDYGAGIQLNAVTPLAHVLADPDRYADVPVLVRARITDVCQRKGCWTVLTDGEAHVRVRFQDYGFFLPTDSTGREAYAQGQVRVETLTEKSARHYEAESQSGDPDRIQGPQRVVAFTATGVRILEAD